MIHSLSGGIIKDEYYKDYALVEILDGDFKGKKFWYISEISVLLVGDIVKVSVYNKIVTAKVIRIDKDISNKCSPIPPKHAKTIICKLG